MAPSTTTVLTPLTQGDAVVLGELLAATYAGKKVRYTLDGGDTIFTGVLRHVVTSPDNFGFLRNDEDVRNGYVRITGISGPSESALPVTQIMDLIYNQLFFI
jgi:hypothetical protein